MTYFVPVIWLTGILFCDEVGTMDGLAIYVKTEKGSEEIQNRKYKLAQKMRSLLIMIDGRKPVNDLVEMAAGLGDVGTMIAELESLGLIEKKTVPQMPAHPEKTTANSNQDKEMLAVTLAKKLSDLGYVD
jgi:hypothetical protein